MSENMVHVVIRDQNFNFDEELKLKTFEFLKQVIPESEYFDVIQNYSFRSDTGEEIQSKLDFFALEPYGSSQYWDIDQDEIDALDYGTMLRPEIIKEIEKFLNCKIEIIWERK